MNFICAMPRTFKFYEYLKDLNLDSFEVETQINYFDDLLSREVTPKELFDLLLIIFCYDEWRSEEATKMFYQAIPEIALFTLFLDKMNYSGKITKEYEQSIEEE